ncbi:MAG: hypothetical protein ACFFFH_00300 [Candidatus Thorarchaeota archaeon]
MRSSKRRSNHEIVNLILNYINSTRGPIKISEISRETRISEKSLEKWLKVFHTIRIDCPDFSYSDQNQLIHVHSAFQTDFETVSTLTKKYREKPEFKDFFTELDSILTKTKRNITFIESQISTKDTPNSVQRQFDPRLNDLQLELSQVLQKGLSHLTSPEIEEISDVEEDSSSYHKDLLLDLKKAVKLGINGLEHIERVDHEIKRKKLTGWRAELVEAFKKREQRISFQGKGSFVKS